MAAKSKHYGDVAKWIERVIDSCKTGQHITAVQQLIENFYKTEVNVNGHDWNTISNLRSNLLMRVNKHIDVINGLE